MKALIVAALVVVTAGCAPDTYIMREVRIEKGPDGAVLKRIETETVLQYASKKPIAIETIKLEDHPPIVINPK